MRVVGFTLLLWVLVGCGGNSVGIRFDATVPGDQRALMEQDLQRLASIRMAPGTAADYAQIGVADFSPSSLTSWLSERTRFIVGEEFDWKQNVKIVKLSTNRVPTVIASLFSPSQLGATTVMWNLGSYLYLDGKDNGTAYTLDLSNEVVQVLSPRVGVIQIGEGLFTANAIDGVPKDAYANSLQRLGTYFHESRHSDFNGSDTGGPHAKCPSGDYKDLYACDQYSNGPYAIQVTLLRYFYSACTGCSQTELEGLMLTLADYRTRLLPSPKAADPRPERMDL